MPWPCACLRVRTLHRLGHGWLALPCFCVFGPWPWLHLAFVALPPSLVALPPARVGLSLGLPCLGLGCVCLFGPCVASASAMASLGFRRLPCLACACVCHCHAQWRLIHGKNIGQTPPSGLALSSCPELAIVTPSGG